jgi:hypothetical protein
MTNVSAVPEKNTKNVAKNYRGNMDKKQSEQLTNDMLITDALLQLKALENLLIAKGIFTEEEFINEMSGIATKIAKTILQNAKVPGDIDALINSIQGNKKKTTDN